MTAKELKQKYLDFFVKKRHQILPNVSLVPENDPTALFTSAGMHPLVPYLLGEPHPLGKRLVSVQRCLRTDDIDEVGDSVHHTFFEMLGNWSLGDYWKKETIEWSYEFLTSSQWLGIPEEKLATSVFAGDSDAPFDGESYQCWLDLGIPESRIAKLPKKNNWWGPAGETGPCGPDTEMFVWAGSEKVPEKFDSDNPFWVEVWNDVFMEYNKTAAGNYEPLKQKNVDTGMGVERTLAVLNGLDDDYQTELFKPIIQSIEVLSGQKYEDEKNKKPMRIMADHLKAAVLLVADGVVPGNVEQGYVLRRLIRRAIRFGRLLSLIKVFTAEVAKSVIEAMKTDYPELAQKEDFILKTLESEEEKFSKTLEKGIYALKKIFGRAIGGVDPENLSKGMVIQDNIIRIDGNEVFHIYETYGFPPELSQEIMTEWGLRFDDRTMEECRKAFKRHQEISRAGARGKFAGGLADHSGIATKYHTATHLLQAALRQVLGEHVGQKGSNITAERLRFDFSHPEKLSAEQIKEVEDLVNQKIAENLPVKMEMMTLEEAKEKGAMAVFTGKYGDRVSVYSIGSPSTDSTGSLQASSGSPFSREICGGPHADFTGLLGRFKILKEEAAGAGIRRIYATLENDGIIQRSKQTDAT